jgi:hypothetical protein
VPVGAIIGALVGGAIGGISLWQQGEQEKRRIEQQRALEKQAYKYQTAYNDGSFSLQRLQSLETLGIQKNRLAEAFNADVSGFNLGLEGQALQNQAARISLADNAGMALAQQGMSGTKGSDTLQRRIDYQESSYNRQLDLQQKSNSFSLQDMGRRYTNQFDDIGREIDSWNPGGYRMLAKDLSDVYARNMHDLKMRGYDAAVANAEASPLDYLTGVLGGAVQGASFGMQIDSLKQQVQSGKDIKNLAEAVVPETTRVVPSLYTPKPDTAAATPVFDINTASGKDLWKVVDFGNKSDPNNGWFSAYLREMRYEDTLFNLDQLKQIQSSLNIGYIDWDAAVKRAKIAGPWGGKN